MQLKDALFSSVQWRGCERMVWSRCIWGVDGKMREQDIHLHKIELAIGSFMRILR